MTQINNQELLEKEKGVDRKGKGRNKKEQKTITATQLQ